MNSSSQPLPNPYVGPRSFRSGEKLYGREREVMALLDLLIAERIVLLYSPSGAGKTSLVQAALIPELIKEGFDVLPIMRVNTELPQELERTSNPNRYVLSALSYLEKELPEDQQTPLPELARLTFENYVAQPRLEKNGGKPKVLIFDQFEEVLTADPTDRTAKEEFFTQVGAGLHERERWALFVMREEYLAALDPYLRPIPTRFSNTFRLEFLGEEDARKAMQEPARKLGIDFTDSVAKKLVDDLRRILVQQTDGTMKPQAGPYVEPVQLQVVCSQLWEKKRRYAGQKIGEDDIKDLGDVDSALAGYYADKVKSVGSSDFRVEEFKDGYSIEALCKKLRGDGRAIDQNTIEELNKLLLVTDLYDTIKHKIPAPSETLKKLGETYLREKNDDNLRRLNRIALEECYPQETPKSQKIKVERVIREWFDRQLITEQGIRGQVLLGPESSGGLDNHAIKPLVDAYLVRSEKVRGATWFELAHDRLINPIRQNNTEWFEKNLSLLQRQASLWKRQDRADGLLLKNKALKEIEAWAEANSEDMIDVEREFLAKCQKSQKNALRIKWLKISMASSFLILFAFVSYNSWARWLEERPWGFFRNLSSGTVNIAKGEIVYFGRPTAATKDLKGQIIIDPKVRKVTSIDFRESTISRLHAMVYKNLYVVDMRSLNGTTVNCRFLQYGDSRKIEDGDILVLAGIVPLQFSPIEYRPYQFWVPSIQDSGSPSGWGMLIDGGSRSIKFLVRDRYFLSLDKDNRFVVSEEGVGEILLQIERKDSGIVVIEDLDDGIDLIATMKEGDYDFPSYTIPPRQKYDLFRTTRTTPEECLVEETHDIFEVSYSYKGVPFQIVPISPDLEGERPATK